jgi:hypothetical protein
VPSSHPVTATATQLSGVTQSNVAQQVAGDSTSEFSKCFRKTTPTTQPPGQPGEPEQPGEPNKPPTKKPPKKKRCKDHTPPVSFLRRHNVRGRHGRVRIVGPSGLRIRGRSHDVKPCRSGVHKVLVSLARVHGFTGVNCRFIKHPGRYDLTGPGDCRKPILFRVKGKRKWHFRFRARLEPGLYRVRVRAYDRAGNKEKPARRNGVFFAVH